jgi:hypothetical protein
MNKDKIIAEFREKFCWPKNGEDLDDVENLLNEATDFLRTALASHEQAIREEIKEKVEIIMDENDDGLWAGREYYDQFLALLAPLNEVHMHENPAEMDLI